LNVIVLGGYGNFGARISRALARDPATELVVAGRNPAKAQAFAAPLGATALIVDAGAPDLAERLRAIGTQVVVHTAGPFQAQGYGVARAAAAAACHYIDLADGRRFVCDFAQALDDTFRQAGRLAVSGASTVPALSAAVIDAALPRFVRLRSVETCIAPAQCAPRGQATLAGVLSYCGAPVQVWRDGRWQDAFGWAQPEAVQFARLRPRIGAICDIPDLELFPVRYPQLDTVLFRAALEVRFTQQVFAFLASLRRRGILHRPDRPDRPDRLAALLNATGGLADGFGTQDGGMVVRLAGEDLDGRELALRWDITAPGNHGPEIPCMAAILLARRLARGGSFEAGARACQGLLELDEFGPEFTRWGMATQWAEEPGASA
jgi:saccharopine dehydrogenase-like NADP-dependent oxidoreductase